MKQNAGNPDLPTVRSYKKGLNNTFATEKSIDG
jgi:hypothetical protein